MDKASVGRGRGQNSAKVFVIFLIVWYVSQNTEDEDKEEDEEKEEILLILTFYLFVQGKLSFINWLCFPIGKDYLTWTHLNLHYNHL